MPGREFPCPECGVPLEGSTGKEGYGHLLICMHVENRGIEQLKMIYGAGSKLHAQRVIELLGHLTSESSE